MKLVLARNKDDFIGYQFIEYNDGQFNNAWEHIKDNFKHVKIIKSNDSTGPYAILETSSLKELVKFEEQFNVIRVEENKYNKQVPYILAMS